MATGEGIKVMEARMDALPAWICKSLSIPMPLLGAWVDGVDHFVATGLGSSEAAARYFVSLLCRGSERRASFQATGVFFSPQSPREKSALVIFSQGLSANACIALEQRKQFAGVILVTASTPEQLREDGHVAKAEMLETVLREGGILITHPVSNEYTILPRFIGPVCSLVAAFRLANRLNAALPPFPSEAELVKALGKVGPEKAEALPAWAAELLAGAAFNFTNETVEYAQNLSAKVMESLYQDPPICRDILLYAHGPFQVNVAKPSPQWVFSADTPPERALSRQLDPLFTGVSPVRYICSPLPEPFAIFYYECFLNRVVAEAAKNAGVDLVEWPGKGLDGAGYQLAKPYTSSAEKSD